MSVLTALISSKIVVAVTVSVVGVGSATAATFTGTLPPSLQEQAHDLVGAPAPVVAPAASEPTDSESPEPTESKSPEPTESKSPEPTESESPEPTDSATPETTDSATTSSTTAITTTTASAALPADTHGLCTAYFAGGLPVTAVAYRRLATDAATTGAADVSGYCTAAGITPKSRTHSTTTISSGTSSTATAAKAKAKAKAPHPSATHATAAAHRGVTGAAHKAPAATTVHPSHG